jgi:hypothetical protein
VVVVGRSSVRDVVQLDLVLDEPLVRHLSSLGLRHGLQVSLDVPLALIRVALDVPFVIQQVSLPSDSLASLWIIPPWLQPAQIPPTPT